MLLLPGAVDPHTHLDAEMFGATTADDFESGTIAAAAGGVTSIVDYAFQAPGGSLSEAISKWDDKARGRAIIDYGFHVAILDPTPGDIAEIPKVVERGVTSFKIFMMRGFEERARDFLRAFKMAADSRALLTIHAEDEHLIGYCTERLLGAGNRGVAHFAASRPPLSEAAAVLRGLKMTELTGAPAYFVHLSSKAAIDEIRRARRNGAGRAVLAETRPIYLYLTQEKFLEPQGEKYVGYPPLRERADVEAIWEALADGTVDVVATDHCSWPLERKTAAGSLHPDSARHVESRDPRADALFRGRGEAAHFACADGRAGRDQSRENFRPLPAQRRDRRRRRRRLVVFDPDAKVMVHANEMHSRADYDPFEGFEVTGWPRMTILARRGHRQRAQTGAQVGRGIFLPSRIVLRPSGNQ